VLNVLVSSWFRNCVSDLVSAEEVSAHRLGSWTVLSHRDVFVQARRAYCEFSSQLQISMPQYIVHGYICSQLHSPDYYLVILFRPKIVNLKSVLSVDTSRSVLLVGRSVSATLAELVSWNRCLHAPLTHALFHGQLRANKLTFQHLKARCYTGKCTRVMYARETAVFYSQHIHFSM